MTGREIEKSKVTAGTSGLIINIQKTEHQREKKGERKAACLSIISQSLISKIEFFELPEDFVALSGENPCTVLKLFKNKREREKKAINMSRLSSA